jgi:hypothetical protein
MERRRRDVKWPGDDLSIRTKKEMELEGDLAWRI